MYRGHYPRADKYLNHAQKSSMTLLEVYKRMQVVEHEKMHNTYDADKHEETVSVNGK
jgi:coatomer subunit beta'